MAVQIKDELIENSTKDEKVEEGILKLAEQHVTEHEYSQQNQRLKRQMVMTPWLMRLNNYPNKRQ